MPFLPSLKTRQESQSMSQAKTAEGDRGRAQAWIALLGTACLVIGGIGVSIALGEGLLRLIPGLLPLELRQQLQSSPEDYGSSHPYHPYIGWLARPNNHDIISGRDFSAAFQTDGYGFRNAWPWPERADIVVVGDSFVFGYGVEDTEAWPALLAQALPQTRLINLGLVGASPQQYLRVYETFGASLQPKVIIVGLLLINDFSGAAEFAQWVSSHTTEHILVWRNQRITLTLSDPVASIKSVLRRYSYVYNLVRNTYRAWSTINLELTDGGRLQLVPEQFGDAVDMGQPERREFQLVLQALVDLQALARQQGASVLVVFQPSKEEVYLPLLGKPVADLSAPLRVALDAHGIAYLDLTAAFEQCARAGNRLFFEVDGHANKQGNQLIAQAVLAHLSAHAPVYPLPDVVSSSSSTQIQCNSH
jgi:lysophospholipase L1-like esterase